MANLLQMQGPDGILYMPQSGRPWGKVFGSGGEMYREEFGDQMMDVAMHGRYLESAAVYHAMTGDPQWERLVRRNVTALRAMVIDKGDFAYFDKILYPEGGKAVDTGMPPPSINHGFIWLAHGLSTVYRMTGNEESLDLAHKLARFSALGHSGWVGPNGEFRLFPSDPDTVNTLGPVHFHTNTLTRMMMLDVAIAKDDREMIEVAQAGYEYAKNTESQTLMGYFPENLGSKSMEWCRKSLEICEVADMIYLGMRQSICGLKDCWDEVDRWVRNMYAEMQLLETDWAYTYSERHGQLKQDPFNPQYTTSESVPERCRGTWGGWAGPNDWQGEPVNSIMACCVGNAAMQLYRLWREMIQCDRKKNRMTIHLLLNRASAWADIDSHIPYRGQVDVRLKRDCEVALRIPEWASPQACRFSANGSDNHTMWEGRYIVARGKPGETLRFQCPIAERSETISIVEEDYRVVVRGNDIVDIDPPGIHRPMFQRPQVRTKETQWRTVERFVPEAVVEHY